MAKAKTKKTVKPKKEKVEVAPVETVTIHTPGVIPVPAVEEKPPEKKKEYVPKKIRVLLSLANPTHTYEPSKPYEVGKDVSEETAKTWLKCGVAIEDKSLEGPEETK